MKRPVRQLFVFAASAAATVLPALAADGPQSLDPKPGDGTPLIGMEPSTQADWLKDARIGAFMHFLPNNPGHFAKVKDFDVEALAKQLHWMGAKYFVLTLGQNSGWFNAPNATYDRITGYEPGERCARATCRSISTAPCKQGASA